MALAEKSKLRHDFGISENELKLVKAFLQGAVYCWVKNLEGNVFAARDLMGGVNFDWKGTPLYCLYEKHIRLEKDDESAIDEAGKDLGWILKSVLDEDKRTFEIYNVNMAKGYRWDGNKA